MTIQSYISSVRDRIAKATPAPWRADGVHDVTCADGDIYFNMTYLNPEHNAKLIASAPTDLSLLCDALEVAIKALERIAADANFPISASKQVLKEINRMIGEKK